MKFVYLIIFAFLLSCQQNKPQQNVINEQNKRAEITSMLLDGTWKKNINENASFRIKNDTMYFLEGGGINYKISNDTMISFFGKNRINDVILKLDADSLILLNEFNDTLKYFKVK